MAKKIIWAGILFTLTILFSSWGFFAHQKINHLAVFTLPKEMLRFYKSNIVFITEHAVDPDKRRYADSLEASKHFLDADRYGEFPFDSIPKTWKDAVEKYSEKEIKQNGIVPWQIERTYYNLVKAFQQRDSSRILKLSADLGHYVADAHVPLHTTENYNGQLTKQTGIHAFWESRLPELFSKEYDFYVGKAIYIENPINEAWKILKTSFNYKDSVLLIEKRLSKHFPSDRKFTFSERKGKVEKQYSEEYSRAYHDAMNGMVERQMRSSILSVGSFWFSAWVDAGQPKLKQMLKKDVSKEERQAIEKEEKLYNQQKIIGRKED